MKLSKRERNLAVVVGGVGLLTIIIVVWQLGFGGEASFSELRARYIDLSAKVEKKTKDLDKAKRAAVKLDEWQQRSLPSDEDIARTLYHNWLQETVNKASFRGTKIETVPAQSHRGMFEEFKFTIRGQATLQHLTQFLFDFYQKGHLHKISLLQITPLEKTNDLDLIINVEALALVDAANRDKLTEVSGNRLQKKTFDDYRKIVEARNIFVAYTPPKPAGPPQSAEKNTPPPPPKFDHLEFTKLTGITEIDGQPVAWIETKTTGQSYKAREGEELDIASAKVKILHIGTRDIEMQIGEEKRTINLGQNLLAKP
jgi:hypothetical protein